jgi:hypothetical protein
MRSAGAAALFSFSFPFDLPREGRVMRQIRRCF